MGENIVDRIMDRIKWEKAHPVLNTFRDIFWRYPVYVIPEKIRMSRYRVKWFFQRMRRGFSDNDFFATDVYIAKTLANILKFFAENTTGYPHGTTYEEFKSQVMEIAMAFDMYTKLDEMRIEEQNALVNQFVNGTISQEEHDKKVTEIYEKYNNIAEDLYKTMRKLFEDNFFAKLWD